MAATSPASRTAPRTRWARRRSTAGFVHGRGRGLDGASFVAVQQWVHDFDAFEALTEQDRDHHFGRRLADNEEIDDSPVSAHVKRTAQENFDPPRPSCCAAPCPGWRAPRPA